ncbi:MAG: hypothetical protein ABFD17_04700 [Anaerolineaceae bacterium]|nr:hypothetical protein [Anaerolineaceae bacterium]
MAFLPTSRTGKIALGLFLVFLLLLGAVLILYNMLGYPSTGIAGVLGYITAAAALLTLLSSLAAIIVRDERSISVVVALITTFVVTATLVVDIINAGLL